MIIPNRIVRVGEGRVEIQRQVMPTPPEQWKPEDPLPFESSLLWLWPIESLDYVRVAVIQNAKTRRGPLVIKGDILLVGYSKLSDAAPPHPRTQCFARRLFYLTPEDGARNLNDIPDMAIDPQTLLPGQPGDAPDLTKINGGYPRHARRGRRSVCRCRPAQPPPMSRRCASPWSRAANPRSLRTP